MTLETGANGCGRPRSLRIHAIAVIASALAVWYGLASPSTAAETPASGASQGLTEQEEAALTAAVEEGDSVVLEAIVIAAIARNSDHATAIVRDLYRLAPDRTHNVVEAAVSTFPDLEDKLKAAATEVSDENQAAPPSAREASIEFAPEWSGEIALGGSYRDAAREVVNASMEADVRYTGELWEHSIGASLDYGRSDGVTDTQQLNIAARTQRGLTDDLYGFGLAEFDDDKFSGFAYQVTEGIGLGYLIVDTSQFDLGIEVGPSLRQSKVAEGGEVTNEFGARLAANLAWAISDSATFSNETSVFLTKDQIDVTSAGTATIDDEAQATNVSALQLHIVGDLAARISYEVRYISDPPPGGYSTSTLARVAFVQRF